ncbi:MAG: helicase [Acidobacteria bacterium]|nr:helicase [Acidobacteriota bacterium]
MTDKSTSGSELFIVDNSDQDWKVFKYLHGWCQISRAIDIATGYFEIGSLLALGDEWQKVDNIRILMGDEVSKRTRAAFQTAMSALPTRIARILDVSLELEKEKNDFLTGVPAIVEALKTGKIECRVYRKDKFHAKAYITHSRLEVVGSSALVGSSNFTFPGLAENVELNVQITGRPVSALQEWYEQYWDQAEDITPEILQTVERHTRDYTPFEVYAKSLQQFVEGHMLTAGEWELTQSRMFPYLDHYQKEGYQALMRIAENYRGAFLCDGVGLGKTFIGLMAIERYTQFERKNVALFVPLAARGPVWEQKLKHFLPDLAGDFGRLLIYNHSDLLRGNVWPEKLRRVRDRADVIVIDEAHHFRNLGLKEKSRYWQMNEICAGKTVIFLTATPINNSLLDLQHMIELFTQRQSDYFSAAPLGVHSLIGHFRKMEAALEQSVRGEGAETGVTTEVNEVEAERFLHDDALFRALVVQRSRAYVKASQKQHGGSRAIFPTRADPAVVNYDLRATYGELLDRFEEAFSKQKPLFSLAIYYPLAYYIGTDPSITPMDENRQKAVISLIRIMFLKRFESSAKAFEASCVSLLMKLLAFVTKHSQTPAEVHRLERWKAQKSRTLKWVAEQVHDFEGSEQDADEDLISPEMLEDVQELSRDEYKIDEILDETILDMDQLVVFINELAKFKSSNDDKLRSLLKLLKENELLSKHKVLIFSEFMATTKYLQTELVKAGIDGIDEVDSSVTRNRGDIISQFSPYYNESTPAELAEMGLPETRVLISTDVLSEGLNLQDATLLINYDIHWNPVRLMQRIGRVDRRLDPEIEDRIRLEFPERAAIREKVYFWNFLPPQELDKLLRLYSLVSRKTLKISKTFGIEGRKLLTPDDEYEALKDFTHEYEGSPTLTEQLRLEYQKLEETYPGLAEKLRSLPRRVFSGKEHPTPGSKAVFFCYILPAPDLSKKTQESEELQWTEAAGRTAWYLFDIDSQMVSDTPDAIAEIIRSTPDTPRRHLVPDQKLSEIRTAVEKHIKNTYLRQVQAPVGVRPILKAWMELS